MIVRLSLTFVAALVALPSFAQKVYIDYDREALGRGYETFAWKKTEETSIKEVSPLMHSRIVNAIEYQLSQRGFTEAANDPDLRVTYHTSATEEMQLNTTAFGYGFGGGWSWDPYWGGALGASTTTVHRYQMGTLVVDVWDARTDRLVWRGSATAVVKENPEKMSRQIEKAIEKMVKKWDKIRRAELKKRPGR